MKSGRLEAFSDGVIAVIITVMVLEIRMPDGADLDALTGVAPTFAAYVISFVYVGIYWNNHHHLFQVADKIDGAVLWANLHLLFWLSLIPALTKWVGAHPDQPWPTALYGADMLVAGIGWLLLQKALLRHDENHRLAKAIGNDWKGKASAVLYILSIGAAFVTHWISDVLFVVVAVIWFIPDRRLERAHAE
jgi:uncharacterized membrane protein